MNGLKECQCDERADSVAAVVEKSEEENDVCAICLEKTSRNRTHNYVSLPCGHPFHFTCILQNMSIGGENCHQCPLCRRIILEEDAHENQIQNIARLNAERQLRIQREQQMIAQLEYESRSYRLNARIGDIVTNGANNNITLHSGAAIHMERQIRNICINFAEYCRNNWMNQENQENQENIIDFINNY